MTRLIERWFPCAEVSENPSGWGSGKIERTLFTWFAARPPIQAKAAVLCSLLPWPDSEADQAHLQNLVRRALTGRYAEWTELKEEILKANPKGVSVLDPFSGRGIIPLEAARLGFKTHALEYSPVAVLASELLTDYPFRDWSNEPPLPFRSGQPSIPAASLRLLDDAEATLAEIGRRHAAELSAFYPSVNGSQPWGYVWAVTIPCQECGVRFPLVRSYELRRPSQKRGKMGQPNFEDKGQSFYIDANRQTNCFRAVIHEGEPERTPTLTSSKGSDGKLSRGKSAICPFCRHVHPLSVHQRLASEGLGRDALLVVADLDPLFGKAYRAPTPEEVAAAESATKALVAERPFRSGVPAIPDEQIPLNNGATIRAQLYGAKTYGDLMCARQTLGFVRLARIMDNLGREMTDKHGLSRDYSRALLGYAAANLVRKIKYSTRGAVLLMREGGAAVDHIFVNESTVAHSYDFFEVGIGQGPATWMSLAEGASNTMRSLFNDVRGSPVDVQQGSAAALPYRDGSISAVVTDPPYDSMVYYSDSSDLFFVWLKRALNGSHPEMTITADVRGIQDKTDEIIVKEHGKAPGEHRDRDHYDRRIARAFSEMRRVVREDGLVTIVFGHGEPEVWQRLLAAISEAGLVMTGSWPARTEAGGQQGKANIETTLTMSCRPARPNRNEGRRPAVEAEIRAEIKRRYLDWERWGLAPTDMLMAAAGPAMEVVGRYGRVLDARGDSVDISTFLPLARAAVQEAMAVRVDDHPLETFDARTRFALWWVRLYGRQVVAKSELRWQALAASMDLSAVRDLVPDADKGVRFITAAAFEASVSGESSVIDVALAMARSSSGGLEAVGEVVIASGRSADDPYLWAAISFIADRLPDSDPDAIAWTRILRNKSGVGSVTKAVVEARVTEDAKRQAEEKQLRLL